MPTEQEWGEIARQLQEPFDPADVEFRPQGKLTDQSRGLALAYVDARVVADRLDTAVGAQNWRFMPREAVVGATGLIAAWGTLFIHGIDKTDIGDSGKFEPNKAAVSDALKRAAVLWGVGRYLYQIEAEWVQGRGSGENWHIQDSEIVRLRAKLPRPVTQPDQAQKAIPQESGVPSIGAAASVASQTATEAHRGTQGQGDPAKELATPEQVQAIRALLVPAGKTMDQLCAELRVVTVGNLTAHKAAALIKRLHELAAARVPAGAA